MLTSYDLGGDDGDRQAENGALLWLARRVLQEDGRVTQQDVRRRHGVVRQHRDERSRVVGACLAYRSMEWAGGRWP